MRDGMLDMLSGCTNWLVVILAERLVFVWQIFSTSICVCFFCARSSTLKKTLSVSVPKKNHFAFEIASKL